MTGMQIDYETADRITLANLKDALDTLQSELDNHTNNGSYMHPEDVSNAVSKYIPALKILIEYYGGSYE
jgi:hypothetical protein